MASPLPISQGVGREIFSEPFSIFVSRAVGRGIMVLHRQKTSQKSPGSTKMRGSCEKQEIDTESLQLVSFREKAPCSPKALIRD